LASLAGRLQRAPRTQPTQRVERLRLVGAAENDPNRSVDSLHSCRSRLHSITLLARSRIELGILMPSALAVSNIRPHSSINLRAGAHDDIRPFRSFFLDKRVEPPAGGPPQRICSSTWFRSPRLTSICHWIRVSDCGAADLWLARCIPTGDWSANQSNGEPPACKAVLRRREAACPALTSRARAMPAGTTTGPPSLESALLRENARRLRAAAAALTWEATMFWRGEHRGGRYEVEFVICASCG
jgi:hypothetical protein